jgi:hypothetical protein
MELLHRRFCNARHFTRAIPIPYATLSYCVFLKELTVVKLVKKYSYLAGIELYVYIIIIIMVCNP